MAVMVRVAGQDQRNAEILLCLPCYPRDIADRAESTGFVQLVGREPSRHCGAKV